MRLRYIEFRVYLRVMMLANRDMIMFTYSGNSYFVKDLTPQTPEYGFHVPPLCQVSSITGPTQDYVSIKSRTCDEMILSSGPMATVGNRFDHRVSFNDRSDVTVNLMPRMCYCGTYNGQKARICEL